VVTRREMVLDADGFAELAGELRELAERSKEIERQSAARLAASQDGQAQAQVGAGVVMMLFEGVGGAAAAPQAGGDGRRPRRRPAKR
jgi:hypothetical protein